MFVWAQPAGLIVSNAASFQQNAGIAPGAIIAIKGSGLSPATAVAPDSTHPPKSLGGVTVTVNDVPCALYYVSDTQINAIIDPSLQAGPGLLIVQGPSRTQQVSVNLQSPGAPAIFTLTGTGSGDGAIVNALTANTEAFSVATGTGPTFLALFVTNLDPKTMPTVWIGGISAPVLYFGDPGVYPGMQQINVQLPASLDGAGRIEVVVEQAGRRSNAVEVVVLPSQLVSGAAPQPNTIRSRELASVAWVPGTSLALVADENDDVVRVVDLSQRRVTRVIALPDGAQPAGIGVHSSGTLAVVAERGRGAVIALDLTTFTAINEYKTGLGASAVAVAGDQAIIANSDDDTVSFFSFRAGLGISALQVLAKVPVGRAPRAVAVDSLHAYVANESAGTITVLDLAGRTATNTISLGIDVRPAAIQILEDQGLAIVAEPSAGPGGKLIFVKLANRQFVSITANPDQTGGASAIAAAADQIYLANQSGGSITATPVATLPDTQFVTSDVKLAPANFKVSAGTRSLSMDTRDNVLLALNEGGGTLATIDLTTNSVTARIDAVHASASDTADDHSDRLSAPNLPSIALVSPASVQAGAAPSSFTLTITGTNVANATGVLFIDPSAVSSLTRGPGNQNRGNFGASDPAFSVTSMAPDETGTKLLVNVQLAANTQPRTRVIRLLTPNGETSLNGAPTLVVQ